MVFECESDGEYVGITGIAIRSEEDEEGGEEGEAPDEPFSGPEFGDLDDTLQQVRSFTQMCLQGNAIWAHACCVSLCCVCVFFIWGVRRFGRHTAAGALIHSDAFAGNAIWAHACCVPVL